MTSSTNNYSPLELYQQRLELNNYNADQVQLDAVKQFNLLYLALQNQSSFSMRNPSIQGLYLWGKVGIGKTFLMDLFYESLPQKNKLRSHFYQFMARIHDELNLISGSRNPLKKVAKKLIKEFRVLCLDELFISEIGDGMIFYHLLEELFKQGLVLVTTSNFPVDGLYKDDLQPRIFDPAVELLLKHTHQLHLKSQEDYRLQQSNPQQTYFLSSEQNCTEIFNQLTLNENKQIKNTITICNRPLYVEQSTDSKAWFTFESLCCGPRSQLDYIELAKCYSTILISNIPKLGGEIKNQLKAAGTEDGGGISQEDLNQTGERKVAYALSDNDARRFISLVDEFYDQGINLYLFAEVPLEMLYTEGALTFEFTRTRSRLIEMQSTQYLNH